MITPEKRERFEKLGHKVVLRDIGMGVFIEPSEQQQAIEWLAEQDAEEQASHSGARELETKRFRLIFLWTVVAAVAGVIAAIGSIVAAWPVLFK
jgi:hypothetical protein